MDIQFLRNSYKNLDDGLLGLASLSYILESFCLSSGWGSTSIWALDNFGGILMQSFSVYLTCFSLYFTFAFGNLKIFQNKDL